MLLTTPAQEENLQITIGLLRLKNPIRGTEFAREIKSVGKGVKL